MDEIENLRKNVAAGVHGPKLCPERPAIPNASHHSSCASRSETGFNKS
jgi:hypothetical protein